MTQPSSSPEAEPASRPILTLKGRTRAAEPDAAKTPVVQAELKKVVRPGARWSDDYTQRMQAEMDALR